MPTPYTPVFPAELAGRADASLVCIASGQYFGCLRDLVFYRGDRSIFSIQYLGISVSQCLSHVVLCCGRAI